MVHPFADSKDAGYVYRTGDAYPRDGVELDPMRVAELESTANALGFPLIEKGKSDTEEKETPTKTTTKRKVSKPKQG